MNKTIAYCALMCLATILMVIAFSCPELISDKNPFLLNFVNHEFLNILGVILAITLASAAQIHINLNSIEEKVGSDNIFHKTRSGIKESIGWLIGLFLFSVLLVVSKPILATTETLKATFNSATLVVILWNVLVLISLTQAVFSIKPMIDDEDAAP